MSYLDEVFGLSGKVAIVTGGGRGIGQTVAIGLAKAGAEVVIIARSNADETIEKITAEGGKCYFVRADVTKEADVDAALAQIMEGRQLYQHQPGQPPLPVSDYTDRYVLSTAAPILTQGDVLGCVAFLCEKDHLEVAESEHELAQAIAGFLGRHMET